MYLYFLDRRNCGRLLRRQPRDHGGRRAFADRLRQFHRGAGRDLDVETSARQSYDVRL